MREEGNNKHVEHINFGWKDSAPTCAHDYILPDVLKQIRVLYHERSARIIDIGCGNGYVASKIAELGNTVIAVDVSKDGIDIARNSYPNVQFEVCSLYNDDLVTITGLQVDCVISLEVVEHLFFPKRLFELSHRILRDGGHLIISTPYHGYLKNLALSLFNGWDQHFKVDQDGGHIKYFSKNTLTHMARAVGFRNIKYLGVGRYPWLWKSMILISEK